MYIEKIFSEVDQENYLFSVILDEEELSLFSEFEERIFARRDYEGLSEAQKTVLRKNRSEYAKQLHDSYRKNQSDISRMNQGVGEGIRTTGEIHGGHVKSNYASVSTRGSDLSAKEFNKFHQNSVTNQMLDGSKKAKDLMREHVLNDTFGEVSKAQKISELAKEKAGKTTNIPKGGKAGRTGRTVAGLITAAGLAYGGKKLYDKYKKKD